MEIFKYPVGTPEPAYDRMQELKAFDDTKTGVKGLVDSGVKKVPRIFVRPPEERAADLLIPSGDYNFEVPIIDCNGLDKDDLRKGIIEKIQRASETCGFFQLVNHSVPTSIMEEMINGIGRFYEGDVEVKKQFYTRDGSRKVRYTSNFDLFQTNAASWRDTLTCFVISPDPLKPEDLPDSCRDIILDYTNQVKSMGDVVIELLSEALGLKPDHLKNMDCTKWCAQTAHCYPACPEPELTLGTSKHTDPNFLTILLQSEIGGLQILYQNSWIDVLPTPGALVVNLGDLLQLITNDKFKSAQHRVIAGHKGPRYSVASFFGSSFDIPTSVYGPIKELLSDDNPPIYKDVLMSEYNNYYISKGHGVNALTYFKL